MVGLASLQRRLAPWGRGISGAAGENAIGGNDKGENHVTQRVRVGPGSHRTWKCGLHIVECLDQKERRSREGHLKISRLISSIPASRLGG